MRRSAPRTYNFALLAWVVGYLCVGAAGLWVLDRLGRLPPPPITGTNCIDEKFKFLRETNVRSPKLIAVGSSVTWRNLDFAVLQGDPREWGQALNAAPCYLDLRQTAYLTRFYLDNLPSVRMVVSVFAMRDFAGCKGSDAFFDTDAARRYVFERKFSWHLYFQNFRPYTFLADVLRFPKLRAPFGEISMDPYGSGPLYSMPPVIGPDVTTMPACFDHLEALARELDAKNVTWAVVLLPPMPGWLKTHDPSGARDRAWREAVTARTRGIETVVIDGVDGPSMHDDDFTDPAHLHWRSVGRFTRWIFGSLGEKGALRWTSREVKGDL